MKEEQERLLEEARALGIVDICVDTFHGDGLDTLKLAIDLTKKYREEIYGYLQIKR
jgi:hypothetical protein